MKRILLLHGSRQTGQLLLGRMDKLRKRLKKEGFELVAVDAPFPHPEDPQMRQWWNREGNTYHGLDESVAILQSQWEQGSFVGLLGFSQGAQMVHLLTVAHELDPETLFPGLQFSIMAAGYHAALPDNFGSILPGNAPSPPSTMAISVLSLHVWGETDRLITPAQSQAVSTQYVNPQIHIHEGGHHVPMRAASVRSYMDFVLTSLARHGSTAETVFPSTLPVESAVPDEETAQTQSDEVEALLAIFPDEVTLISSRTGDDAAYQFPIVLHARLDPTDEGEWPPHLVTIQFQFPDRYPQEQIPTMRLIHDNNVMEMSTARAEGCVSAMKEAAQRDDGMPCVMSCLYAAREFFETVPSEEQPLSKPPPTGKETVGESSDNPVSSSGLKPATSERISQCSQQGLDIAEALLKQSSSISALDGHGNGGSWKFTMGLIGKPSVGKSTFFNTATAFARQQNDTENVLGGAAMAPRPFTTIDPNVGFCLVPAPAGSCPEEQYEGPVAFGSSHGRDPNGQRFLPVLLKDVAGLVPGAYEGRGRGNQFLNDLTAADVLIHVVDASGTSDSEGNSLGHALHNETEPLTDLAWILKELIEWVHTNISVKWESIQRKGRSKLTGMFSGYRQTQSLTNGILNAVESYMEEHEGRDHSLENLDEWDEGDIHRLIVSFLGVRFPMILALNKYDLPTSKKNVEKILNALPTNGAHVGTPVSAHSEMCFVRDKIRKALGLDKEEEEKERDGSKVPAGVWKCLQEAMNLRHPILMFPVVDFISYQPLSSLTRSAVHEASLPSPAMVSCMLSAGGQAPTHWNPEKGGYVEKPTLASALRDVVIMKPGSTVEDLFLTLKKSGALAGEFIRAEAAEHIGQAPKPVPKQQAISRSCRIIKIMTSKRSAWQGGRQ